MTTRIWDPIASAAWAPLDRERPLDPPDPGPEEGDPPWSDDDTDLDPGAPVHPSVRHVLDFFAFDHLPAHLREVSRPFAELAREVAERAPENPETTVCLRKLLEAKDAAVRASLPPR